MVDLSLIFHSYGTLYQRLPEAPQLHRTSASKQSWRKSGANFGCPIHGEPTWNHGKIYENLLYFMDDLGVAPWHIPIPTQSKMPLLQDFHIQKKNLCCFFLCSPSIFFVFCGRYQADTKPQLPKNALALTQWMTLGLRSAGIVSRVAGSWPPGAYEKYMMVNHGYIRIVYLTMVNKVNIEFKYMMISDSLSC